MRQQSVELKYEFREIRVSFKEMLNISKEGHMMRFGAEAIRFMAPVKRFGARVECSHVMVSGLSIESLQAISERSNRRGILAI